MPEEITKLFYYLYCYFLTNLKPFKILGNLADVLRGSKLSVRVRPPLHKIPKLCGNFGFPQNFRIRNLFYFIISTRILCTAQRVRLQKNESYLHVFSKVFVCFIRLLPDAYILKLKYNRRKKEAYKPTNKQGNRNRSKNKAIFELKTDLLDC